MPIQAAPTVRESLESAMETVVPTEAETPQPQAQESTAPETAATTPVETKTDDKPRDKDGKFIKADEAKPAPKAVVPAHTAEPAKPKIAMPTSWKKELAPYWDTLPPQVQENVIEREKQYATGVSTYKGEADRAKIITQALAQFEPMLQKKGIATDKWIQQMGIAHYLISEGTQRERVEAVAAIIKNNGIDISALGQLLAGQQPQYQQQPQQQSSLPQQPIDIDGAIEQALLRKEVDQAYKAFTDAVAAGKHPHYEEVKGTMAGLLQAGISPDYTSAYEAALALPQHRDLVQAVQAAPVQAQAPAAVKDEQAKRARSQAVSVKSSTPSTMAQATGLKGLRDQLSENFDKATASRV